MTLNPLVNSIMHENQRYYFHKVVSDRKKAIDEVKRKYPGTKYYYTRNFDTKTKKEAYYFYLNKKVD